MKFLINVICCLLGSSHAFTTTTPFASKSATSTSRVVSVTQRKSSTASTSLNLSTADMINSCSSVIAYSDDPIGDQLSGMNGAVVAAILLSVVGIGFGFTTLLPSVGSVKFALTDEEEIAIAAVDNGYDSRAWEKELTEQGTQGYVNRKALAQEAKEKYQESINSMRDVKDRSLRYSEAGLGFIACLIRAAEPAPGDKLVDLGSGFGRSTIAAATIFPSFSKCVGIEFLQPLVKASNTYKNKVRGRKAPVEFQNADFAEADLSTYDIAFVSGSFISDKDLSAALSTLPSGAKVMSVDKRLGAGFSLITQVDDPSGDLVLNTGYLYQKN